MSASKQPQGHFKANKKYLQPPTLSSSGLLSSQDRNENRADHMHQLSNVEQKSYASSDEPYPQQKQIREFLDNLHSKPQQPQQPQSPLTPTSVKSKSPLGATMRLEDQQIIAVEEEYQLESNKGDNQSVILEHMDFNHDEHEWKMQDSIPQSNTKMQERQYQINYNEAPWNQYNYHLADQDTPPDFIQEEAGFKHIRHSKNTCMEKIGQKKKENNNIQVAPGKRSWVAPPLSSSFGEKDDNIMWSPQLQQMRLFNQKIQESEEKPQQDKNFFKLFKTSSDQDQILANGVILPERNSSKKTSTNRGYDTPIGFNSFENNPKGTHFIPKPSTEILQTRCQNLAHAVEQLQSKIHQTDVERQTLEAHLKQSTNQLIKTKEYLRARSVQLDNWKTKIMKMDQKESKYKEQIERLERTNQQLERDLQLKDEELQIATGRNKQLQLELQKSNLHNSRKLMQSTGLKKVLPIKKKDTFGMSPPNVQHSIDHSQCLQKIQSLEQTIFDLEQKSVGVDIQVDRRVKLMSDHLEITLRRTIHHEYEETITQFKKQIMRLIDTNNSLQADKIQLIEETRSKERELQQRQNKVKKMYDELVIQWRELQQQKNRIRQSAPISGISPTYSSFIYKSPSYDLTNDGHRFEHMRPKSPSLRIKQRPIRASSKEFSQNSSTHRLQKPAKMSFQNRLKTTNSITSFPPQTKTVTSRHKQLSSQIQNSVYNRYSFGKHAHLYQTSEASRKPLQEGDEMELFSINSKIQKLRSQINRELQFIH